MKKAKKILTLVACAVLLVCISVGATLAYLTSKTEVVTNTFTVGKVEIKLDETDVDVYGVATGNPRDIKNEYKLMPNHTYIKDPMVTVKAESEESYIRMKVTLNNYEDLLAIFTAANKPADETYVQDFDGKQVLMLEKLVSGWDPAIWKVHSVTPGTDDTVVYEFRYTKTVDTLGKGDTSLEPLFETITMPDWVTNAQIETLGPVYKTDDPATEDVDESKEVQTPGLQIDIVAHAIQADGFNGDEEAAWTAFGNQVK